MDRSNVSSGRAAAGSDGWGRRFAQCIQRCAVLGGLLSVAGGLAAQQTPTVVTSADYPGHGEMSPGTAVASASQPGQPTDAAALPDAPAAQSGQAGQAKDTEQEKSGGAGNQQTKRILDILPNFRAVSTTERLPPMTVKQKFVGATEDSFDYSAIFIPAMLAWYSLEESSTPEFGQGAVGYGRYFWHAAVDQTSENYMVEFVVPAVTHEDPRYYTLGHGGFFKRTGYALSRAVVTRTDSDKEEFNFSEVVGAGASAGLSSLYYPSRERSLGNTGREWGLDVAIDGASFVVKEFWPDINHRIFHQGESSRKQ